MDQFTPFSAALGGLLIGLAAVLYLYFNRQICGISGIYSTILPPGEAGSEAKVFFILGLLSGGALLFFFYPEAFTFSMESPPLAILFAGFLVGFGSRLGKGCTSGHGVCGLGRLAGRSMAATAIFFVTAMITASALYLIRG